MSTTLTEAEKEALAEPVYDAYRLGKYGSVEYLDAWHHLEVKPTETPEQRQVYAAVEAILAAREAAAAQAVRDQVEAVHSPLASAVSMGQRCYSIEGWFALAERVDQGLRAALRSGAGS